jgi:hypothetical protein
MRSPCRGTNNNGDDRDKSIIMQNKVGPTEKKRNHRLNNAVRSSLSTKTIFDYI